MLNREAAAYWIAWSSRAMTVVDGDAARSPDGAKRNPGPLCQRTNLPRISLRFIRATNAQNCGKCLMRLTTSAISAAIANGPSGMPLAPAGTMANGVR
ncbi:hypothetical protein CI1B_71420 [Bradyrhizobium ivorense]|uniref:Uncharacterized protein n=1 Tax=Bradyrhizobium ivorense TaxID=2511166 RepID=A0A508TU73_9BRAD|nr:hypothetical protein CI1B_71420 [Bradyrhizobium ivorense]